MGAASRVQETSDDGLGEDVGLVCVGFSHPIGSFKLGSKCKHLRLMKRMTLSDGPLLPFSPQGRRMASGFAGGSEVWSVEHTHHGRTSLNILLKMSVPSLKLAFSGSATSQTEMPFLKWECTRSLVQLILPC